MPIVFDTLAYANKLKAAGFTEKQAEVQAETFVEIINDNIATKLDIENVKKEIELVRKEIKELEVSLKRDMKELELRLKYDLTVRLGGMMAASIAIVAGLVKFI